MNRIFLGTTLAILLAGCVVGKPSIPVAPVIDHFPEGKARVQLAITDARMALRDVKGSETTMRALLEAALLDAKISTDTEAPIKLEADIVDYDVHPKAPNHANVTLRIRILRGTAELYRNSYTCEEPGPTHVYAAEMHEAAAQALHIAAQRITRDIASDENLQKAVGKQNP
jgi:hypothetical protein